MVAGDAVEWARQVGEAEVVREVFDALGLIMAYYQGPDLRVAAGNAAFRSLTVRQDVVGRPLRELVPEFEGQQILAMAQRVYTSGQREVGREWRIQVDPDSTGRPEFFLDFVLDAVRGPDGTVTGIAVYAVDVTERVREREAARARAAEAERRYEVARDVVSDLQQALLPTALPVLPRVRIAARYLVAVQDQAAGGDWFDAIVLPAGDVALVVGDVVGHGVAASAAMGQLRAVLKHVVMTEADPAAALAQVDGFAAGDPALRAATLCLAVLDPGTGRLRYATCGHPAPLVITPGRTARYLPGTGAGPLGTGSIPVLASGELGPGETLLLYSDGLIERPGRTLDEARAELAEVAADAAADRALPDPLATPAERVCQQTVELLTRTGYADDVTALAAWRQPAPPGPLDRQSPAELASVTHLRRALDQWLEQIGPASANRQAALLTVTELVTNAVEHAYPPGQPGPVRLEAALGADGYLDVLVSDDGCWQEPDPSRLDRGHGLMLAEYLAAQMRVCHSRNGAASGGTVVRLRHQLHRPAMLASKPGAGHAPRLVSPAFAADLVAGGTVPVVRVAGPVDVTTADCFTGRLLAACRGGVLPLTADLTAVTFLASAGVRALHRIRGQLAAHEQDLTLISEPGSSAAAVLDLVRLPRTTPPGDLDSPARTG